MKRNMLLVFFILVSSIFIYSAPLKNFPVTLKQPDGSLVHCFVSGDEFHNWYHDKENYTIMQHPQTGFYVYAVKNGEELQASDYVVDKSRPQDLGIQPGVNISVKKMNEKRNAVLSLQKGKGYQPLTPYTGTLNNLVIFIRFSDDEEFNEPVSNFDYVFNASGAAEISMYNYYYEASYQQLQVVSHFFPASTTNVVSCVDAYTRGYHQPYNAVTNPTGYQTFDEGFAREVAMVHSTLLVVKNQVPPNIDVDGDNDGVIDNITFIIKGEPGAWGEFLWPHMTGMTDNIEINGAYPGHYNIQIQSGTKPGVLCHEMFHSIGAPDLYHYTYNGIYPTSIWDLMDGTVWEKPQHMGAYMKYKYGKWINSVPEITATGTYTLNPITSPTNNIYKIKSPNSSTEFFILEYRRNIGTFESLLPGSGLLVYRINSLEIGNADGPPDEVYVYRPNGTLTVNGDYLNAFYSGDVGRTRINNNTNPTAFLSDGSLGGLNISNIGTAGNTISFKVNFNAANKDLSIIYPNGNEELTPGSIETINWLSDEISSVKIEYTSNDGVSWTQLANVNAALGSYDWLVPNDISSNCKIRISDAIDPELYDVSDNSFSIVNSSTKVSVKFLVDMSYYINEAKFNPASDQLYIRGSFNNWEQNALMLDFSGNNIYSKTLSLDKNSTYEYKYFITTSGASNGGWESSVGTGSGGNRLLQTGNTNYEVPISLFDNYGKLLQLLSPVGGEVLTAGLSYNIQWNSLGINNIKIEYTTNNGSNWNIVNASVSALSQNYNWMVPEISTEQCKIKISDAGNLSLNDQSKNVFTIVNWSLELTSPNGGETWLTGSKHNIVWQQKNISNVKLEYSTDSGMNWLTIVESIPASNLNYEWTTLLTPKENCKVRISSVENSDIKDVSDDEFTVYPLKQVYGPYYSDENTVALFHFDGNLENKSSLSGDGTTGGLGISFENDKPFETGNSIKLNDQDFVSVLHTASLNLAGDWTIEAWVKLNEYPTDAPYILTKPGDNDAYFANYSLQINSYWDNVFYGFYFSQGNNRIGLIGSKPALNKWYHIAFIRDTQKSEMRLILHDENKNLVSSLKQSYTETTVLTNSQSLKIGEGLKCYLDELRISNVVREFSNSELKLNSPNGGESFPIGSTQNITWSSNNIDNIKIEYTTDKGTSWNEIVSSTSANTGIYSWTIPDIVAYEYKIRISNSDNAALNDTSDGIFITYTDLPVSIAPLLSIEYTTFTWPLNAYYPVTIPSDDEIVNGHVGNACGPTAMANVLRYWEFPRKGTGSRSFTDQLGCLWSADFGQTVYNYDRMPETLAQNSAQSTYDATATLMYHAGVGMHDQWRTGAREGVIAAFKQYFNYSTKAKFLNRANYTPEQWEKIFKSEFVLGRPIIIGGDGGPLPEGGVSGHWFICDGYNSNNLFHIKWDYGTASDEYLPLYEFKPYHVNNYALIYLEPDHKGRQLQLTSPAGNENWQQGSQQTITWNSTNVSTLQIEYSINNRYNWITLASSVPAGTGSYNILIPSGVSDECKIRITDESDINIYSKNKSAFHVYETKSLSLLSPNGGVYYQSGSKAAIVWNSSGLGKVDIEYKIGETGSWIKIVEALNASTKTFKWLIPEINSDYVKVRVIESGGQLISESNSYFSVGSHSAFGSPYAKDNNTVLLLHFDNDIVDDAAGAICSSAGKEKIFPLSGITGLGNSIQFDNTEQLPTYISIPSSNLLRLSGSWTIDFWFYISSWDKSFNNWPIPFIKLNSGWESNYFLEIPASEKRFKFGFQGNNGNVVLYSDQNIVNSGVWYHIALVNDFTNRKLKLLLHNSNKEKIYESSLSYPSETTIKTGDGELRIGSGFAGDNQFDGLIDEFRISNIAREFRSLILSSLNGGENLLSGGQFNITWLSQDVDKIKLEYTTNNGTSWIQIVNNVNAKLGSYNWTIPSIASSNCKIRISNQSDASIYDISDKVFTISETTVLTLKKPNGGENWYSESKQNITWESKGIQNVKIELSTDNGHNWNLVADGVSASAESYTWTIPDLSSNQCLLKLSDASNLSVNDTSDAIFSISKTTLLLTSPNGKERWYNGTVQEITWISSGILNIRIQYSTNNGSNWKFVATSSASSGKYFWTIPEVYSKECKVQISSVTNASVVDVSDDTFNISPVPSITVVSPNGGEKWNCEAIENVTWSSNYVDSVNIQFSFDSGTHWNNIVEGFPADSSLFKWTTPNTSSKNYLLKIYDAADSSIFDESNNVFSIDPLSSVERRWASGIPEEFMLYQNYPNPFNPTTRIRYQVPEQTFIRIQLFDILGNAVQNLVDEMKEAGYYEIELSATGGGTDIATGIYLIKMNAGSFNSTKKIMLMK